VADWARALLESQLRPSAEIAQLAARFKADPAGAAAAATRFVQDEVRYLGVEMGPNSHQPHPPEQVLRQRFGDCKDKALLLVAIFRELGIEAAPALVDTVRRRGLDQTQPSPFAFDHVIVRAQIGGRETWIDATESDVGGRIEEREPPEFERALVLVPGTTALSRIPLAAPTRPTVHVVETFTLGAGGDRTRLEVVSTYRGAEADAMRRKLAATPAEELAKSFLDDYAKDEPEIKATAPPTAKDDRERNVVTVSEAYEMASFWKNRKRELRGWAVTDRLPRSVPLSRKTPLSVPHPVSVRHEVIVRADGRLRLGPYAERVTADAFTFSADLTTTGHELRLAFEYRSLADAVLPDHLKAHQAQVARVEDAVSFLVLPDFSSPDAPQSAWQTDGALVGAGGAGVGIVAVLAWVALRARRRTSRSEPQA
jgi:hypothetical protein